jgi:hypothetical protein
LGTGSCYKKIVCGLFKKEKTTINGHIKNIFSKGELNADSTVRNFRTVALCGKTYDTAYYNLDVKDTVLNRFRAQNSAFGLLSGLKNIS